MRILLTGATGFLGAEILAQLMKWKKVSVVAWGRDLERIETLKRQFSTDSACLRIEARDLLESYPPLADVDTIIHAAALRASTTEQDPAKLAEVNVGGTRHVVRIAERTDCQRLIYISTQSVYGGEGAPWVEESPLRPETLYARSKRDGEAEALLADDMDIVILRLSRIYGVTRFTRWDELPGRFAKTVSRGEPLAVYGNGEQRLDLLHVRDAARCIAAVATQLDQDEPMTLNVGSGSSVSLNELAELCSQLAPMYGFLPVTVQRILDHPLGKMRHLELNIARVREAIGWSPEIGLREGLSEYLGVLAFPDSPRTRQRSSISEQGVR